MPDVAPAPGVEGQKAQLDQITKALMQRVSAPQAGGMQKPIPQFSEESMQKQGYDTTPRSGKADIGQALGNFGSFVHNMVAEHKQNQIRTAMSEWQGFDHALTNAQALAGDPSAPDYQEKVKKMLTEDPWVKANLNPADPKAVKRLKNMYKALNVDLLEGDKENVHRDGLKKHFQVKEALEKVKKAGQAVIGHKQQSQQQMDPAQQQGMFKQGIEKLMGQQTFTPPDPKVQIEAARVAEQVKALEQKPTIDERWYAAKKSELGREPSSSEIEAHQVGKSLKPVDQHIQKGMDLMEKGDKEGAAKEFQIATTGAQARKSTAPSMMDVIHRANAGDPEAAKDLHTWVKMREDIADEYGKGRAMYNMGSYMDKDGHIIPLSNLDAVQRIRNGELLIPSGKMSAQQITMVQRMQKEATPAMDEVNKYIGSYDNKEDRLIFAQILKNAGAPPSGQEAGWMHGVLTQALSQKLSPDGKLLTVRLRRLADTMGTVRSALGLPATEQAMSLTLSMIPGPGVPDSKFAKDVMDQLNQTVTNALEVPALRGVTGNKIVKDKKDLD
jgi:hypothetical protein